MRPLTRRVFTFAAVLAVGLSIGGALSPLLKVQTRWSNEATAKAALDELAKGVPLRTAAIDRFGEAQSNGYLFVAARINRDGTVGRSINLRTEGLPKNADCQVMAWPREHGVTGSIAYAMIVANGRTEVFTNASPGFTGENIVNRGCNCFVDTAREIVRDRSLAGQCCAHGPDVWVPVTN